VQDATLGEGGDGFVRGLLRAAEDGLSRCQGDDGMGRQLDDKGLSARMTARAPGLLTPSFLEVGEAQRELAGRGCGKLRRPGEPADPIIDTILSELLQACDVPL